MGRTLRSLALAGLLALAGCAAVKGEDERALHQGSSAAPAAPNGGAAHALMRAEERLARTSRPTIRLLVRDFLPHPGALEEPEYGYYSYLLFTEESDATYARRRAAARAFMCQPGAGEAQRLDIAPGSLAVLYAPVRSAAHRERLRRSRSGSDLLQEGAYDYLFAQLLAKKLGLEKMKVGIVAYPRPLDLAALPFSRAALGVVDMSKAPPEAVERAVLAFRARMTSPRAADWTEAEVRVPAPGGRSLVARRMLVPRLEGRATLETRVRAVLASLGALLDLAGPPPAEAEAVCR